MSRNIAFSFLLRVAFAIFALLVHAQTSSAEPNASSKEAIQASTQKIRPRSEIETHSVDHEGALVAAITTRPIETSPEHEMRLAVFVRNGQTCQLLAFFNQWVHYSLHRQS